MVTVSLIFTEKLRRLLEVGGMVRLLWEKRITTYEMFQLSGIRGWLKLLRGVVVFLLTFLLAVLKQPPNLDEVHLLELLRNRVILDS